MSKTREQKERESNALYCALLMPKRMFIKEWNKRLNGQPYPNDKQLQEIADLFQVSLFSVMNRANQLKLVYIGN